MRIVKIAERTPVVGLAGQIGTDCTQKTFSGAKGRTGLLVATLTVSAALSGCGSTPVTSVCSPDPVAIVTVAPAYHPKGADADVDAYAVFDFTISKDGDVTDVELIESGSSPSTPDVEKSFTKAARKSMALWRFNRRGTPCQSRQRIDYPG